MLALRSFLTDLNLSRGFKVFYTSAKYSFYNTLLRLKIEAVRSDYPSSFVMGGFLLS